MLKRTPYRETEEEWKRRNEAERAEEARRRKEAREAEGAEELLRRKVAREAASVQESYPGSASFVDFVCGDGRTHGFPLSQLLHYQLEANLEMERDPNAPPDQLTLHFSSCPNYQFVRPIF